jgi:hypothetical protein
MMRTSDGQRRLELVQRGEVIWQAYINGRLTPLEYLAAMHPIERALAQLRPFALDSDYDCEPTKLAWHDERMRDTPDAWDRTNKRQYCE